MEQAVPPLPPVEALRRNLLYAMFGAVTEEDMACVVAKQVEKAKQGDSKAARLLIDMVRGEAPGPSRTQMQQAIVVTGNAKGIQFISDTRRQIVQLISATGPLTTVDVAGKMHLMLNDAAGALDHPWFAKREERWHITECARAEVLGS